MCSQFDIVVIGAGSGGLTAAVGFRKVGKRVLLVEREHMGGECTNTGCIPSKALLHHAKTYYQAATIAGVTTKTTEYRDTAFAYTRSVIDQILTEETPAVFERMGITVVMGEAQFTGPQTISVNGETYHFTIAIVATGSGPRMISVPGLSSENILTNQNIFSLNTIPAKTLVIGAGPIGLEMGQALALLGSKVTIATIDDTFLPLEDMAIRRVVQKQFESLGITIECKAALKSVAENVATFTRLGTDKESFTIPFNKILLAIGRVPNLPRGLELAGVASTEQGIVVDNQYRTSNKNIYALGDVASQLKFTHVADDAARQVVARVISRGLLRVKQKKAVPKVTYTSPEIAQVGLSWSEAIATYGEESVLRIEVPFSHNDRAKTDKQTDGILVVIVRRLSGKVIGAHCVGPAAGELIAVFTLAIDNSLSLWKLRSSIYAYPTYALIIKRAGDYFFATQVGQLGSDVMGVLKRLAPKAVAFSFWMTLLFWFHDYRSSNDLTYTEFALNVFMFFTTTVWGPIIYIMVYALRPLVLFPASLLTALAGTFFGFWWGSALAIIGGNASANVAYWIGRYFGKDSRLEYSGIGAWVSALRQKPFETTLFMRLFYLPFDLVNYGAGILKISWPAYATGTFVGMVPGAITFVALGAALDSATFAESGLSFTAFHPGYLLLSVIIFIASIWLSNTLKRWHQSRTAEKATPRL